MKETQNINASLEALANVLSGLSSSKTNVIRYRDSKLTRFLQDSLGGNSRTCFIVNIRSNAQYYRETLQSLRYGQRAKLIKNSVVMNIDSTQQIITSDPEEVSLLKMKLTELQEIIENQKTENQKIVQLNNQINSENKQLRRRLALMNKNQDQQVKQFHRKIDNLIHTQTTQLAENRYQYLTLQSNIVCYRKQIYDLTCEISQLQQQNYIFSSTSQQAKGEICVLQENTEKLLTQRDDFANDNEKLQNKISDLQQEVDDLQLKLEEAEDTIQQLKKNNNKRKPPAPRKNVKQKSQPKKLTNKNTISKKSKEISEDDFQNSTNENSLHEKSFVENETFDNDEFESNDKDTFSEDDNDSYMNDNDESDNEASELTSEISSEMFTEITAKTIQETPKKDFSPKERKDSSPYLSDGVDDLNELDDSFEFEKPAKKAPKRKGKKTPKNIPRKRTSMDFFNLDFSEDEGSNGNFTIEQVKPAIKRRRLNSNATIAINSIPKSTGPNLSKNKTNPILKNFFPTGASRLQNRLELVEDKENNLPK